MKAILFAMSLTAFLVILSLGYSPAEAQTCGMPRETTTITTPDGSTYEVLYYERGVTSVSSNQATITGDGFCIVIQYQPAIGEDWHYTRISISTGDQPYSWDPGIISLDVDLSYPDRLLAEGVNTSALPPEHLELWSTLRTACSDLIDCEEFWALLTFDSDEARESLRESLEKVRDGLCMPSSFSQILSIQYNINSFTTDGRLARGYSLGATYISLMTPSEWGAENPELFIENMGDTDQGRWSFHLDPMTQRCIISSRGYSEAAPTIEQAAAQVDAMAELLRSYQIELPGLIAGGLISEDNELVLFLARALEGLEDYEIVCEAPHGPLGEPVTEETEEIEETQETEE